MTKIEKSLTTTFMVLIMMVCIGLIVLFAKIIENSKSTTVARVIYSLPSETVAKASEIMKLLKLDNTDQAVNVAIIVLHEMCKAKEEGGEIIITRPGQKPQIFLLPHNNNLELIMP